MTPPPDLLLEMDTPIPIWAVQPLLDLINKLAAQHGYEVVKASVMVSISLRPFPRRSLAEPDKLREALKERGVLGGGTLHNERG